MQWAALVFIDLKKKKKTFDTIIYYSIKWKCGIREEVLLNRLKSYV